MSVSSCTDDEFIQIFKRLGSPILVSAELKVSPRNIMERRRRIENRYGIQLPTNNDQSDRNKLQNKIHAGRYDIEVINGKVIIFSDAHYWPGFISTAHRALIKFCKKYHPVAVINNGDAFDGASVSRFPRPFFDEEKPTVKQELDTVDERLTEIEKAAKGAKFAWNLGNHDLRFEARLAAAVPQYQGVQGFHLKDRFPRWIPAWSTWINDEIEVRHRYKGGQHATYNNVKDNHHTTITGHLHNPNVKPYTDGRGITKYGVDAGCLADPNGPQFSIYLEGRYPNWRSGFIILSFHEGRLLYPQIVEVISEDEVSYCNEVIRV